MTLVSNADFLRRRSAASANVPDILKLVQRIRAECPGKDIWVWTGYKLDELNAAQMQVVDLINVLVDGKFVQDLKDPSLIWRGSSNQVVHHCDDKFPVT